MASDQLKPCSLRRGGATDLWFTTQNYSTVAHAGRWSSERTLKVCIQDSVALLTSLSFHPTLAQRRFANLWLNVSRVELPHEQEGDMESDCVPKYFVVTPPFSKHFFNLQSQM